MFEPEFWMLLVWRDLRLKFPDTCYDPNATFIVEDHQMPPELVERHLWMPPVDLTGLIEMQPRRGFSR